MTLRPVREADLAHLAEILPDDYEHDPRAELFDWLTLADNRRRLVYQSHWHSLGTWSPSSWTLSLAVEVAGVVVGVQSLEARNFPVIREVETGSWLVASARGRGIGVAMRVGVLALAFDHLDAVAALTSARLDNAASLGVSRHLGYRDNGVSRVDSGHGPIELAHRRLTATDWHASGHGHGVTVTGLVACRPWFG